MFAHCCESLGILHVGVRMADDNMLLVGRSLRNFIW